MKVGAQDTTYILEYHPLENVELYVTEYCGRFNANEDIAKINQIIMLSFRLMNGGV